MANFKAPNDLMQNCIVIYMHLPNTLTDMDVLAQGKEALRSAEFVRKIFCMVARATVRIQRKD